MEKLTKLEETHKTLMSDLYVYWNRKLKNPSTEIDVHKLTNCINWLYNYCGLDNPEIIICDSPYSCQLKYMELSGDNSPTEFSLSGNIWDYGWIAFYQFYSKIGVLKDDDLNSFISLLERNIYDMIQLDTHCIVSRMPEYININNDNKLHSEDKPAIRFIDGYEQYWIEGNRVYV